MIIDAPTIVEVLGTSLKARKPSSEAQMKAEYSRTPSVPAGARAYDQPRQRWPAVPRTPDKAKTPAWGIVGACQCRSITGDDKSSTKTFESMTIVMLESAPLDRLIRMLDSA